MADSGDEFEVYQSIGPHESEEAVKSKAVVKFSAVQVPVKFNRLECNTNLNLPPSNWLTTSDSSYGLHQALYQPPGFTSFRMGHMFPDCVGRVDVVSDAENIKKLLKLPYTSKSAISMIVHKVGNTLLLDEFDIQKYLLRKADDDWKWLRTFILEQILSYGDKDRNFCIKDKSREAIQTKNLLSKFLYYSLKQSVADSPVQQQKQQIRPPLPITGPVLPEPKVEENVPDPKSSHVFNRNVLWTFEDIRMLIGTDMPIFGGPNRPCISLRLRDTTKPINVLTGIDYWLDNLMCNVPEVVMCYHLDGIVQKYEIIKTEDLPYMEDSQFSPQVVRNVAQNILAFLKANATKAGHTYWLFKGRNDDVVKLYDLSTLCKDHNESTSCDGKQDNPFTVPVAMLLYTVARNMKITATRITPKTAGNIRALLDNCIRLLPKEKYPQICTSSHYILSDLHIPAGIDPKSPNFETDVDSDTQSLYDDDEGMNESSSSDEFDWNDYKKDLSESADMEGSVAMKDICDTFKEFDSQQQSKGGKRAPRAPSPLNAGIEERCRISLEHISAGISCLQFSNTHEDKFIKESEARAKDEEKQRILYEEQNPNMAKPFKPIPLPYESLSRRISIGEEISQILDIGESLATSRVQEDHKYKKLKPAKRNKNKTINETYCNSVTSSQTPQQQQNDQVALKFNSQLFGSWHVHLKLLLLEKACLTYATLAEHNYVAQKYGASLKAIYMACRAQQVVLKYMSSIVSQKSCLLGRAGDCYFQISKNWDEIDEYIDQYQEGNDIEININKELEKDLNDEELSYFIVPIKNLEHLMLSSCRCYETALDLVNESSDDENEDTKNELLRRLGNVRNELGLKYMYWAQEEYSKIVEARAAAGHRPVSPISKKEAKRLSKRSGEKKDDVPVYINLSKKSYDCLKRGITAFNDVQDNVNLAFLYCNMGRFMRFRAHLHIPDESINFIDKQKTFYNEAFINYERAKEALGSRKSNIELWDLVNWELSTATFTLAKQLQDFSTADVQTSGEVEKEVLELLQKALKLCDVEHAGSRQVLYSFRAGLIHKRIASFHYSQLRNSSADVAGLPKTTLQLCKHHYEKAANILDNLKEATELLVVQLERISLYEFLAENSNSHVQKLRHLQAALEICLSCKSVFEYALTLQSTNEHSTSSQANNEEFCNHMLLFENRLQYILKTSVKLLLSGKDPRKLSDVYKKMYMETLTGKRAIGEQKPKLERLAQAFLNLLERLTQMEKSHSETAEQL